MVLVALREQDHGIWVLERDLILKQPHIVVISLEAMLHDEKVHADEGRLRVGVILVGLHDLRLADLVRALDLLHEGRVRVLAVALFEDDRVDLRHRLLQALRLNLELRRVEIDHALIAEAHLAHLSEALFDGFALDTGQVFVRLANILVSILW